MLSIKILRAIISPLSILAVCVMNQKLKDHSQKQVFILTEKPALEEALTIKPNLYLELIDPEARKQVLNLLSQRRQIRLEFNQV